MRLFIDDSDDVHEHCNVRSACELNKTFSTELDAAHNRTNQPHITHVSADPPLRVTKTRSNVRISVKRIKLITIIPPRNVESLGFGFPTATAYN